MSIKTQKQDIQTKITAANISEDLKVSTALYPEGTEALKDVYSTAKNSKASVLITYSGKKYLPKANIYATFNAFTIFIYSKILEEITEVEEGEEEVPINPLDIESLIDSITSILYLNGYTLFEDDVRPVIDKKTGLYEAVIIIGKDGVYPN